MPALLRRHPVLATADLDEARSSVGQTFCPHRLTVKARHSTLSVVHNAASVGGIGMNYLRYGQDVRITPGTFDSFYLVQIPLHGTARVRVGETVVQSDRRFASLPSPTLHVDMEWSADCEQLLVHIPRDAVQSAAQSEPGTSSDPVVFHPLVDMNSPAMSSWMRIVHLACDEAERETGILSSPLAASHFEQVLVTGLLAAQPNSSTQSPQPTQTALTSRTVRCALDLIREQPEYPWKVAELATRVGVGPRTLQAAFRRERGTTPLEELRRVRLARAHADLVDAAPDGASVTEVATRWGFFHLGRFSQFYRAEFGLSPSQTLAS
ncbi:AraC family transcriptional regulator [Rhodococcus sp. P1Y]|uniref:AraC family transcriptional regulator n=1 Tax=Rhodococcus sp. P1Y TaxID=1302308 RepID=UPI0019125D95|nr:AraC family transcriptional regulator [Rhodococcus sp. P1Y]